MKKYPILLCLLFPAFMGYSQTLTSATKAGEDTLSLVKIEKAGKYGFTDTSGKVVIAPVYDAIGPFQRGLAIVQKGKKTGYLLPNGKTSSLKYDSAWVKEGRYHFVKLDGKVGLLDDQGKELVAPKYEEVNGIRDGYVSVKQGGKYGVINPQGKMVLKPEYERLGFVTNGTMLVYIDGKCGRADLLKGKVVMTSYEKVGPFRDGMAWVRQDKKFGFINADGDLVIPVMYDWVGNFNEGLVAVATEKKYGFINKKNQVVIAQKYDKAYTYTKGKGMIRQNGRVGYVDMDGNETWAEAAPILPAAHGADNK